MVKDSMEIMDQGACSGTAAVPIHYYDVDRMQERIIESCQGDLTVICNVLADYADMLDEFLQTDRERLGFCGALQYERMRDRCRKITADLQEKTGYDRAAAIEKCRKRAGRKPKADAGIGEDALVLSARRRAGAQQPAAENKKTE
ncbi:hypothetical protein [uncultured Acetatifactor sp.]|uniref:hypothetical protein n=1 Tax=uncultured Acetatifactor sp. TaxID=1671927 RepID=UPI002612DE59|nr:hypothetical protein [uncultured Acetatifactor sp.]